MKAFRLFKSINNVNHIIQLLSSDNNKDSDQPLVLLFKGIEDTLSVIIFSLYFHYFINIYYYLLLLKIDCSLLS